jgi:hypothetical protein
MESYVLYQHKAMEQSWSDMYTSRLIGAIEYMLYKRGIPLIYQGAGTAKSFFTDKKLQSLGFYIPGKTHANDAIRHPANYLLFGPPKAGAGMRPLSTWNA